MGKSAHRRMRVLHLIKSLGRGGAETLLVEGLRAADRGHFDFEYGYFVPWKDAMVQALREQGASVTCFHAASPVGMLARTQQVARLVRTRHIDLIHAHLPWAGVIARIVGAQVGIPVVYTEHNLMERYRIGTRVMNVATWALQDDVVAVSNDVASSARRHCGAVVPIRVVQNGVSLEHFCKDPNARRLARARLGLAEEAFVVGAVAVFRVQKRLQAWLEAAAALRRERPHSRFLLVGDGPERTMVEQAIDAHALRDAIVLPGLQEDVRPYLAAMDAYLMTSRFEGLPIALLEAMASELPVVCTAVGGIPEVVTDGVNGFLVDADGLDAVPAKLRALCDDESLRNKLGAQARAIVASRFGMTKMQRELEAIYEAASQRGVVGELVHA